MIFTIADQQYRTTKEKIKEIFRSNGFKTNFKCDNPKSKYCAGYYKVTLTHSFKTFREKLLATKKVKEQLEKLEKI